MGYEYKGTIQDSIIHYYDHVLLYNEYTDDVLDELDRAYRQAAKADEYEAKARAFNEIEYLQGEFDCGSEYRDFYSDVVKVIHRWQRGEFDE